MPTFNELIITTTTFDHDARRCSLELTAPVRDRLTCVPYA